MFVRIGCDIPISGSHYGPTSYDWTAAATIDLGSTFPFYDQTISFWNSYNRVECRHDRQFNWIADLPRYCEEFSNVYVAAEDEQLVEVTSARFSSTVTAVPEPSTALLLAMGLVGMAGARNKRSHAAG